jgi:co-chaperonin GroES (HSP10)
MYSKDVRPIGNRILIEPRKVGETSPGGIVTPEAYRQRDVAWDGLIKSIGPKNKLPVVEGQRVLVNRYNATIVDAVPEMWLAKPEDIIAILEYKEDGR